MISLHPQRSDTPFDPQLQVAAERRPASPGRPWIMTNMIISADGATAVEGRSAELGGPADAEMFAALRSVADAILVGAETLRVERYRRPGSGSPEAAAARRARGQQERPLIAVVSASAALDPDLPLFQADDYRPLVLTTEAAPAANRTALARVADIVVAGEIQVAARAVVEALAERGHGVVLSEGGPSVNGQLVADDLIDEWNLTISPLLAGGDSDRPATWHRPPHPVTPMMLDRVWLGDELLFCRWLRRSSGAAQ